VRLAPPLLLFVAAHASCAETEPLDHRGELRGPCYANGTCNEPYVCASNVCVDFDAAPGGAGGSAGSDASAAAGGAAGASQAGGGGEGASAGGMGATGGTGAAGAPAGGAPSGGGGATSGGAGAGGSVASGGAAASAGGGAGVDSGIVDGGAPCSYCSGTCLTSTEDYFDCYIQCGWESCLGCIWTRGDEQPCECTDCLDGG
jgi:hypothetical protein